MVTEHTITRTVEFVETDMAGIMHFSNYFRWMEACESSLYRALGLPQISFVPGQVVGWPRVGVSCDYRAPLRFGDEVQVRLLIKKIGRRSVTYVAQFRKAGELVARGEVTAVCVTGTPDGKMAAQAIPADIRAKIGEAPESECA